MLDPIAKAKWVLANKNIGDIPAMSLETIADSEGIRFRHDTFTDKWDGMLVFNCDRRFIIVNTRIDNKARHNFTFAHELGHYFLEHPPNYSKDGQGRIECEISETNTKQSDHESEANRFAVELLMPEERFSLLMLGAEIDFALVSGLSTEFMVSKQACSYRIMDFTQKSCVVIFSKHGMVTSDKVSKSARGLFSGLRSIPDDTAAHKAITQKVQQNKFEKCDAGKWLSSAVAGQKIYECTRGSYKNGVAMTILK